MSQHTETRALCMYVCMYVCETKTTASTPEKLVSFVKLLPQKLLSLAKHLSHIHAYMHTHIHTYMHTQSSCLFEASTPKELPISPLQFVGPVASCIVCAVLYCITAVLYCTTLQQVEAVVIQYNAPLGELYCMCCVILYYCCFNLLKRCASRY
jgi:hypothetical protein